MISMPCGLYGLNCLLVSRAVRPHPRTGRSRRSFNLCARLRRKAPCNDKAKFPHENSTQNQSSIEPTEATCMGSLSNWVSPLAHSTAMTLQCAKNTLQMSLKLQLLSKTWYSLRQKQNINSMNAAWECDLRVLVCGS